MTPRPPESAAERPSRVPVVLNVNDNAGARYLTTITLKRAGFEVLEATDGTSALQLAERLPDVVVLDVQLPDIDGYEVCRRIRSNPATSRIKVLHTSATFVTLDKKVLGLESGADGYLAQPFEVQELVATVQSLLRLGRAEADLRDRAEQLAEAGRRKDEFLAMLAHELRNPLAAISACLPLLSRRPAQDQRETRAREIAERQVLHLGRLVDDLLDVARVTRGKIELHPVVVDVGELLERVVTGMRETKAAARHHRLQLELPQARLHTFADPTRLEQIFTNLLDNACKYTDPGGNIDVTLSPGPDPDTLKVRVQDTGMGISPESVRSIFGLFSQGAVAIDRARGGLGIGLTLVKTLVELHGGSVTASSEGPGKGSSFEVMLPLTRALDAEPVAPATPELDSSPRKIVLVEDNTDVREVLVELWEMWGHRVSTASDGPEGVRLALSEQPDIAFIDIGLPGLDGYEVARRIRAEPAGRGAILVALTGYGSPEQRARALESGFDRHLVKPVDPKQVLALLSELPALVRARG